mmetsp:Transcript_24216/g.35576  ORF Transcript_24216/g.35576 Transcript_24216/m.35576 type:complete len:298 (+) Transcript_24216:115-1008(+)
MTIVVFACKSNTCRSQMAEGWAHEWVRTQHEELGIKNTATECVEAEETGDASSGLAEIDTPKKLQCFLQRIMIASVALDASAIYKECESKTEPIEDCCGNACFSTRQLKVVKEKAVNIMAEDGIDISRYAPKSYNELLPSLRRSKSGNDITVGMDKIRLDDRLERVEANTEEKDSEEKDSEEKDSEEKHVDRPVDKLVILCSCGNEVKRDLVKKSKSVEEWNIDAPTALSKGPEGDNAYRRVSQEIKKEVYALMENLAKGDNRSYRSYTKDDVNYNDLAWNERKVSGSCSYSKRQDP